MRIFFTITLLLTSLSVFSQSESLIKISPFHFFDATFYASYEQPLNNNRSFQLEGGLRLADNGDDYGWMGELQVRKYLQTPKSYVQDQSLKGFYVGLYANAKYFKEQDNWIEYRWIQEPYYDYVYYENGDVNWSETIYHDGETEPYTITNTHDVKQAETGVLFGFQTIINNALSLDLFLGGGLRGSDVDGDRDPYINYGVRGYTGVTPKAGFSVGVFF